MVPTLKETSRPGVTSCPPHRPLAHPSGVVGRALPGGRPDGQITVLPVVLQVFADNLLPLTDFETMTPTPKAYGSAFVKVKLDPFRMNRS